MISRVLVAHDIHQTAPLSGGFPARSRMSETGSLDGSLIIRTVKVTGPYVLVYLAKNLQVKIDYEDQTVVWSQLQVV